MSVSKDTMLALLITDKTINYSNAIGLAPNTAPLNEQNRNV